MDTFKDYDLDFFFVFNFLSSSKRTPEIKSTTSVQHLVFINQPFYIAVRHNVFTVITVPVFQCLFPRHPRPLHFRNTTYMGKRLLENH